MNQKRSETLIKKIDTNTELLISRLQTIVALSASTSSQETQASETLQIESNASMIVRLVEEMLSVSRNLKESWVLGQLPRSEPEIDITAGYEIKVNQMLSVLMNTRQYAQEGELSEEEEEVEEDVEEEGEEELKVEEPQVLKQEAEIKIEEPVKLETSVKTEVSEKVAGVPDISIESQIDPMELDTNGLGDYDFENFGNMEGEDYENDIMKY